MHISRYLTLRLCQPLTYRAPPPARGVAVPDSTRSPDWVAYCPTCHRAQPVPLGDVAHLLRNGPLRCCDRPVAWYIRADPASPATGEANGSAADKTGRVPTYSV
jgi:hypothetical protein